MDAGGARVLETEKSGVSVRADDDDDFAADACAATVGCFSMAEAVDDGLLSAMTINSSVSTRPRRSSTFFCTFSTRYDSIFSCKVCICAVRQDDSENHPIETHGQRHWLLASIAPVRPHDARNGRIHLELLGSRITATANPHRSRRRLTRSSDRPLRHRCSILRSLVTTPSPTHTARHTAQCR